MLTFLKFTQRLIPASAIGNPKNKYLVTFAGRVLNPVTYLHHHDLRKLSVDDPLQTHEIAYLCYHLTRKNEHFAQLLARVDKLLPEATYHKKNLEEFRKTLLGWLADNEEALSTGTHHLKRRIIGQKPNLPVEAIVKALYAVELNNVGSKDVTNNLLTLLKSKMNYISLQNIIDLTAALHQGKYYQDKELWAELTKVLEAKVADAHDRSSTVYAGFSLNQYEDNTDSLVKPRPRSVEELYLNDLLGRGRTVANARWLFGKYTRRASSLFFSLSLGEKRKLDVFREINPVDEKDNLLQTINDLPEDVIDKQKMKNLVETLRLQ